MLETQLLPHMYSTKPHRMWLTRVWSFPLLNRKAHIAHARNVHCNALLSHSVQVHQPSLSAHARWIHRSWRKRALNSMMFSWTASRCSHSMLMLYQNLSTISYAELLVQACWKTCMFCPRAWRSSGCAPMKRSKRQNGNVLAGRHQSRLFVCGFERRRNAGDLGIIRLTHNARDLDTLHFLLFRG